MNEKQLEAYLERIGFPCEPTLDSVGLVALQVAHLSHIPFDNMDSVLDQGVADLSVDHLFEKMVEKRRGGICYEQNSFFGYVLETIGFKVRHMSSHGDYPNAQEFDHMFLLVDIPGEEDSWICDVGFGFNSHEPIRFIEGEWQSDGRDQIRVDLQDDGRYHLTRRIASGEEAPMYSFLPKDHAVEEYLPRFRHFLFDEDSSFRKGPSVSIDQEEGRKLLTQHHLSYREKGEDISLEIPEDRWYQVLEEEFGISV